MFEHISEVAGLVQEQGGTDEMIAAAWLHDIVEDTDVTLSQIEEWFGSAISALVDGLTDPEDFEAMPLEQRKQLQADRIRELDDDVKRIKLCDQLSNAGRVLSKPPLDWSAEKQRTYIEGARKIALECRGLWPALDDRFDAVYAAAGKKFSDTP
jgi:guanosine-3',5'-bis(diphosphate) 3'-pyrophosphohydrolase